MSLKFAPKPYAVKRIREARNLDRAIVASESGLKLEKLIEVETKSVPLARGKILALSKALAVPTQYLFFEEVGVDENIPDFRTRANRPAVLSPSGLNKVERAKSLLAYLEDEMFSSESYPKWAGTISIKTGFDSAVEVLSNLYTPVRAADGSVDPDNTFRETRVELERQGIIVLCDRVPHDEFRGFCISRRSDFSLIFINTFNQRPATKLFTLMHEVVHVAIGKTGVSDPGVLRNDVERFCNRVTAAVMMPEDAFRRAYERLVSPSVRKTTTSIARQFGVSKQAAAIRISELGLSTGFYDEWVRSLPKKVPLIEEEEEKAESTGGGGLGAQIGRFGYLLPAVLGKAISKRSISPFDAYRLTNLKPKTMQDLARNGATRLGR